MVEETSKSADPDKYEQERQDKLHDDYLKHRGDLDRLRIEQLGSLDKAVLTLSSSAIGFSIILFTTFVNRHNPAGVLPLVLAWFFFVVAIICNLVSYWAAAKSIEIDMDNLDAEKTGTPVSKSNCARSLTTKLTGGAVGAFIAGVLCLLAFAFENALAASNVAVTTSAETSPSAGPPAVGSATNNPTGSGGVVQLPQPGSDSSPMQDGITGSKPPVIRPSPPPVLKPNDPSKPKGETTP